MQWLRNLQSLTENSIDLVILKSNLRIEAVIHLVLMLRNKNYGNVAHRLSCSSTLFCFIFFLKAEKSKNSI